MHTSSSVSSVKKDIILLFVITVLAVLFIPRNGVSTSGDTQNYLRYASQIYNQEDIMRLNRGPVFPITIALAYFFNEESIKSGFYVVRIFFAMNLILTFVLGRILVNRWVGFIAAIMALSSCGLNIIGNLFLADTIVPFFILLYLILLYKAILSKRLFYFILSGIVLGIEFLTKEYYFLLFLLMPLLLLVLLKAFQTKDYIINIGILCLSSVLTILPWIVYVLTHGGHVSDLLGKYAKEHDIIASSSWVVLSASLSNAYHVLTNVNYVEALQRFYTDKLCPYFPLSPIMMLCLIILSIKCIIKKSINTIFILASIFVLAPVIILTGHESFRIGGIAILYYLLYIVIGMTLFQLIEWSESLKLIKVKLLLNQSGKCKGISQRGNVKRVAIRCGIIILAICLISYEWFNPEASTYAETIKGHPWRNTFWLSEEFSVGGRHKSEIYDASKWINAHIQMSTVFASAGSISDSVNFFLMNKYQNIPFGPMKTLDEVEQEYIEGSIASPIFIFCHPYFGSNTKRYQLVYFVYENDIIDFIKENQPGYILLSHKEHFYSLYFDTVSWAERVYDNLRATIYKIDLHNIESNETDILIVSNRISSKMNMFSQKYPEISEKLDKILLSYQLESDSLSKYNYEIYQANWIHENIPTESKVIYSYSQGIFPVTGYHANYTQDRSFASVVHEGYDYLFIHGSSRRASNYLPELINDLKSVNPHKYFPNLYYFEDGWEIYSVKSSTAK